MRSGSIQYFTVPTVVSQLLPASPNRRAIMFTFAGAGSIGIGTDQGIGPTKGLVLLPNAAIVELTYERYGDLVCKQLFIQASAAGQFLGIVESYEYDG